MREQWSARKAARNETEPPGVGWPQWNSTEGTADANALPQVSSRDVSLQWVEAHMKSSDTASQGAVHPKILC